MAKIMMKMLGAAELMLAVSLVQAEPAEYVDENGKLGTNTMFSVVTAATAQLTNGWYLVEETVRRGEIDVAAGCTAHLILADGASLTVLGGFRKAGIDVSSGEEPEVDWLADGYGVFANPDPTTCADYPYAVLSYKTRENWRIR